MPDQAFASQRGHGGEFRAWVLRNDERQCKAVAARPPAMANEPPGLSAWLKLGRRASYAGRMPKPEQSFRMPLIGPKVAIARTTKQSKNISPQVVFRSIHS